MNSGNYIFFHVTSMFVNMTFNTGDRILVKILYPLKGHTAQKLLKDFQVRVKTSEVFGGC